MSAAVMPPVNPLAEQASSDGTRTPRPRRRWEVWRSPAGQPGWARPALLAVAALAAVLYAWNIASVDFAPYYSVAVKSMSESWKAFFYGAFDPAATITIDKLPGAFVPQAMSVRIFGFHPWSLALPQVAEGVVTVLVMYRAVRQWAGEVPGLLAALLLTLTPIAQASAAGPRLVTRLWQLAVAGVAMLAVSLSWILLFTATRRRTGRTWTVRCGFLMWGRGCAPPVWCSA